jgi:hypothetical protein
MQNDIGHAMNMNSIQELNDMFDSLQKPYNKGDVVRFSLAYQRLYPKLNGIDRRRAEKLVDEVIFSIAKADSAGSIAGVA